MSKIPVKSLSERRLPLAQPTYQLEQLHQLPLATSFAEALETSGLAPYEPRRTEIFQINLGKLCNQSCRHCHVDAGPDRNEVMSRETMQACLRALDTTDIPSVDITGGAPELVPGFRWLVEQCKLRGRHVMDRCNLTIIETAKYCDLPEFFAEHEVEVICSLPHYRELNTDKQRGSGVFKKSLSALKKLNAVGYGQADPKRRLVLVTNPVGAFMPATQGSLEREWKRELLERHDIRFDALYTITNMPISRYLEWLLESGNLLGYMQKLVSAFNPAAASAAMCRNTISVSWDGFLYDCDFNQMLDMKVDKRAPRHISEFDLQQLAQRQIQVDTHCFGCSAGAGSSCGGATA